MAARVNHGNSNDNPDGEQGSAVSYISTLASFVKLQAEWWLCYDHLEDLLRNWKPKITQGSDFSCQYMREVTENWEEASEGRCEMLRTASAKLEKVKATLPDPTDLPNARA
jgi:hypothetical protein